MVTSSLSPALIWFGPTVNSANISSFLALHMWSRLNTAFYNISVSLEMSLVHTLVAPATPMNSEDGLMQIDLATRILAVHTLAASL